MKQLLETLIYRMGFNKNFHKWDLPIKEFNTYISTLNRKVDFSTQYIFRHLIPHFLRFRVLPKPRGAFEKLAILLKNQSAEISFNSSLDLANAFNDICFPDFFQRLLILFALEGFAFPSTLGII